MKLWSLAAASAVLLSACAHNAPPGVHATATLSDGAAHEGDDRHALEGDDLGERGGGVRVPLGSTAKLHAPADGVLDIKVEQEWDGSVLRCTAIDESGQSVALLPPPRGEAAEPAAHGGMWVPLWTIAATPSEITVGCADPDHRIPNYETAFIRVVPRGLLLPVAGSR